MKTINQPIKVKLHGGPLDGDTFELIPFGSVLPPMRLSYLSQTTLSGSTDEIGCWLNYECDRVAEWCHPEIVYRFAGKDLLIKD